MSYTPLLHEEILRQHKALMQRNAAAEHAARLRAERPAASRLEHGRLLIDRIPRLRRTRSTREAYT